MERYALYSVPTREMDAGVETTEAGETLEANDDELESEDDVEVGINERNAGETDREERLEDKGESDDGIRGSPHNMAILERRKELNRA